MSEETNATGTALARVAPSVLPAVNDWATLKNMAEALYKSGLLPRTIGNQFAALAIIEKGRELGIPPMQALSHINMIDGKPSADAQVLAGMIYSKHGDLALQVVEETEDRVTIAYKRRGWTKPRSTSFTMEDAKRAGLTGKQNWQKYPKAMLTARCISKVAHMAFQDVVGGLYTPEELAPDQVMVDASGNTMTIVDVTSTTAPMETVTGEVVTENVNPEKQAQRDQAVAWYRMLQQIAIDREHPQAEAINKRDPEDLSDRLLASGLTRLRELFPDVPEPGAEDEPDADPETAREEQEAF